MDMSSSLPYIHGEPRTHVSRLILSPGSPVPAPRTYHASCLLSKFMIVSAGEANNTDLNDMWALDLELAYWFKLDIISRGAENQFISKRFHTISTLSQNRVVSFGGCHSEYVHLNEVNVFYLDCFIQSNGENCSVNCERL